MSRKPLKGKSYPDRSAGKGNIPDRIPLYQRVYFPRFGKPHIQRRKTIFLKTNPRTDIDIKRLATRFKSIDEQWILRTCIHMMAQMPMEKFNELYESYLALQKRRIMAQTKERRKKYPLGSSGRIMNAGGLDWLIWSKSTGRTMKDTAERIDVPPSAIQYFLKSRYDKRWSDL